MKNLFRVLLVLVPAIYLTLVGNWNPDPPIDLNLLVYTLKGYSPGALVLAAFLLGVSLTALGFTWPIVAVRLRLRRESRRVAQLEQEVHGLRTLPLSDDDEAKAVEAREG